MASSLKKIYKDYAGILFDDLDDMHSAYDSFSRKLKSAIKKDCAEAGLEIIKYTKGYFEIWIEIKNPVSGKVFAVTVGDMRWTKLGKMPLDDILFRDETNPKNFLSPNRFARLDEVIGKIAVS